LAFISYHIHASTNLLYFVPHLNCSRPTETAPASTGHVPAKTAAFK
jgi:hypothetical protein